MEATLDQSGRIELPKELRDGLGLSPRSILAIEERGGGILLKPVGGPAGLVRKDGVLVFAGEIEGDLTEAVQRDRDERLRKVSGLG
jgi:AbrB family looped-hinge helix DNA binding protein